MNNDDILVYPNPVSNNLNYSGSQLDKIENITIIDVFGKQILSRKTISGANHLDVSNLQSGLYFIKFDNKDGSVVKKFIKK